MSYCQYLIVTEPRSELKYGFKLNTKLCYKLSGRLKTEWVNMLKNVCDFLTELLQNIVLTSLCLNHC